MEKIATVGMCLDFGLCNRRLFKLQREGLRESYCKQKKKKHTRSFVSFEGKRVLVTARGTDEENSNKKPFRFYTTTEEPDRVSNFFILFLRKI